MPMRYKIDVLSALKEKGYNTNKIRTEGLLSQSTLQKFRQQQGVSWENLETLCRLLKCQPGDLLEYTEDCRGIYYRKPKAPKHDSRLA